MDGLDPPRIASQVEQYARMLPELLEFIDESVLQVVERRENGIGEGLAQMAENLLSWVQFWTVGREIERMHIVWPAHLIAVMTARTVEHDSDRTRSQLVAQMVQKEFQAVAFHRRQQEKDACTGGGFHRRIQPKPLVLVLDDPGRTFPQRAPASTKPGDQAKATLIHGHHVFECWL